MKLLAEKHVFTLSVVRSFILRQCRNSDSRPEWQLGGLLWWMDARRIVYACVHRCRRMCAKSEPERSEISVFLVWIVISQFCGKSGLINETRENLPENLKLHLRNLKFWNLHNFQKLLLFYHWRWIYINFFCFLNIIFYIKLKKLMIKLLHE